MVKTVRGTLPLEELKNLLTVYARKLPSYKRVVSENIVIEFDRDRLKIELREPKEEKCFVCEGTGQMTNKTCYYCDGTGKLKRYDSTSAKITEYESHPHKGLLKIEVQTDGKNAEIWKKDVGIIRDFLEKLAGKRCVIIPTKSYIPNKSVLIQDIKQKQLTNF